MKKLRLNELLFLSLCCDFGLISKRLIAPLTNVITDALHIPGGVGTSFSLMFLVIAVVLFPKRHCGMVMGFVQSVLAFALGQVGSMGLLAPIGYIVPGIVIDLVLSGLEKTRLEQTERMMFANAAAAVAACLTANLIVFHLHGLALVLYVCVALTTGTFCGWLGSSVVQRLAGIALLRRGPAFLQKEAVA